MTGRPNPPTGPKLEKVRTQKKNYMRSVRQKKRSRFIGPTIPHLNSLEASTLSGQVRALIRRTRNRVATRRKRDKEKLLAPVYSLATTKEMKEKGVKSWFIMHAGEYTYVLHLANWEFYSSKLASKYPHGRQVLDPSGEFGPTTTPKPEVEDGKWIELPDSTIQSLDTQRDLLHVAREGSPISKQVCLDSSIQDNILHDGTPQINYSLIVNGLMTKGVGSGDKTRSPDSWRINFGFNEFSTPTSFGHVDKILEKNANEFKKEIGRIAELLCATMQTMQVASGNGRIWTNNTRDRLYAAVLRKRLGLSFNSPMRAEMIAVCTMKIHPNHSRNNIHRDKKNPEHPEYNRSGTFNAVVSNEEGHLHLFQVLVASRRYAETLGRRGLY